MIRIVRSLFVALLVSVGSSAAFAHGVSMKLRHPLPADSAFNTQFLLPWAEKIHKDAGGRITIHVQAGDSAPEKLVDLAQSGDADIVWTALAYTPGRFTALEAFELPLLTKTADGASKAMWDYLRLSDAAQIQFDGMRVLAAHTTTAPVLHTRAKAIASTQDLKGLKIAAPTAAGRQLLIAAGATSSALSPAQIDKALADGSIDGALLPWEAAPASKIDGAAKHHTEFPAKTRIDSPVFVLLMSDSTYKGLADDLKKVMNDNSGPAVAAAITKALEATAASARKSAADRGDSITSIAADALPEWQKAAQAATEAWIKSSSTGGANTKSFVDAAKEASQGAE